MSEVRERVLNAISGMTDSEVQKIWIFISNSCGEGESDWESIKETAPDIDEIESINQYKAGNPDYIPSISQEDVLSRLGISL